MSRNICRVVFPDGTELWGVVCGAGGLLAMPQLHPSRDAAWDHLHDDPIWPATQPTDAEPVVIESHYGSPEWWRGQASRTAMTITEGRDPYPDDADAWAAPSPLTQGTYPGPAA